MDDSRSAWEQVPGASVLKERLGFWPSFHDAVLVDASLVQLNNDTGLKIRLYLNEGGPMDILTLSFGEIWLFDVKGWANGTSQTYFLDSDLDFDAETGRYRFVLQACNGTWTIEGGPLTIEDYQFGPEGK